MYFNRTLRHFILTLFTSLFLFQTNAQILTFDFNGLAGSEASASSNNNDPNLAVATISRGGGLNASNNGNRFNANNWALTNIDNAVTGDDYMEFTVTPNTGYEFSITSIDINFQRSGTGTREIELRSSVDGYVSSLGTNFTITDNTSVQTHTFSFAQSASASPVTFRFYGWAESTSGTGGFEGSGNDIVVNGVVTTSAASTATMCARTSSRR